MKIIALLPMKAHSERVKNKNFKDIAGKPLFKWMLDKLLEIEEIESVIINTDAEAVLKNFDLEAYERVIVEPRPEHLCGDMVSMNLIIEHDIDKYEADMYLMTHTTNPVLSVESIRSAILKYQESIADNAADSLFSVTKQQTRFYDKEVKPVNHDPAQLLRTQDLEPWYEENSNLYIFNRESFLETNARIGSRPVMYETSKVESIDIDDMDDFVIAEAILNMQRARQHG